MLQRLGLIDDAKKPTSRAVRLREDAQYPEACNEIIEAVFPQELREAFPPPNPDRKGVETWFRMKMQVGDSTASSMAKFYLLLCEADPSKQDQIATSKPASSSTGASKSASPKKPSPAATSAIGPVASAVTPPRVAVSPGLQLNIEIHIAPETSPERIDQIFASMAKHLKLG